VFLEKTVDMLIRSKIRIVALVSAAGLLIAGGAEKSRGASEPQRQRGRFGQRDSRVLKERMTPHWLDRGRRLWYPNDLAGGAREFILVDAEKGTRERALDHARLAAALSRAAGDEYRGDRLPFDAIEMTDDSKAVLLHPEFYKAAVANCGCHDNRMDKASWNEQWMGYPVGPWYAESSNIENAARLQGRLFLIVGELDTNVPPESTLRFADALIRVGKDFDLLVVPNGGHGVGNARAFVQRRIQDFFLRHLQGVEPPNHNAPGEGSPEP
jgi:pimeloyl-ACP methyl ester carboxylesterase